MQNRIGVILPFIGKAPGGSEGRVNNKIGHLASAVIDVIVDRPALGIRFDVFLDFEDSGSRYLSLLSA